MVEHLSDVLKEKRIQRITLEESKTVTQLLLDLGLSDDHIVLVDGKRVSPDFLIDENESVVILPRIAGG